jgi:hypothetical protein
MNQIASSNEVLEIPVRVTTRWHQLSIFLGMVTGVLVMVLIGLVPDVSLWLILPGGIAGFVLPPFLAFRVWPVRDTVTILSDALLFAQRGRIPYASLASYSTDDYLKLVRHEGPTWMLTSIETPRLRAEFVAAIDAWQAGQGTHDRIIRRRFYGSTAARILGVCLVVVSIGIAIFSWVIGLNFGAMGAVGLGVSAAAVLLPKRE